MKTRKLIVVGDTYGSIEAIRGNLLFAGVIDKNFKWIAKNVHVVFQGDILIDRYNESIECIRIIKRLRKEANDHNSIISCIAGNHDSYFISIVAGVRIFSWTPENWNISFLFQNYLGFGELHNLFPKEIQGEYSGYSDDAKYVKMWQDRSIRNVLMKIPEFIEITEELCTWKLCERIENVIVIHTSPVRAIWKCIHKYTLSEGTVDKAIDKINTIFQEGLKRLFFGDGKFTEEFERISVSFLETDNRFLRMHQDRKSWYQDIIEDSDKGIIYSDWSDIEAIIKPERKIHSLEDYNNSYYTYFSYKGSDKILIDTLLNDGIKYIINGHNGDEGGLVWDQLPIKIIENEYYFHCYYSEKTSVTLFDFNGRKILMSNKVDDKIKIEKRYDAQVSDKGDTYIEKYIKKHGTINEHNTNNIIRMEHTEK